MGGMWRLERYARVVGEQQLFSSCGQTNQKDCTWKHYISTAESSIQLSLLENNHLVVSGNGAIYESVSLWENRKWLRVISKGDSALFILKSKDENRRFRVKFSPLSTGGSSTEACRQCIAAMSSLVSVSDLSENSTQPPSSGRRNEQFSSKTATRQLPAASGVTSKDGSAEKITQETQAKPISSSGNKELVAVGEVARILGQSAAQELGDAYRSTNFPTEQLGPFIRLCLTDSNFPGFVEAVEKELQGIVGN